MTIASEDSANPKVDHCGLNGISDDLGRLDTIITDAIGRLMESFGTIQALAAEREAPEISRAAFEAVTALQFQDMATQLIAHCRRRLDHAGSDGGGSNVSFSSTHFAPVRTDGPVSPSSVGAGTVDLF
ncbi:MAG: hypothetical protein ACK5QN_10155 [Burkholderiales bacterium]